MVARRLSCCAVALLAGSAGADVIFDSSHSHPTGGGIIWVMADSSLSEPSARSEVAGGGENEGRVGAAITFAGTNRLVSGIQLTGTCFAGENGADLVLSIHTDDGGAPGALIWSGTRHMAVHAFSSTSVVFAPNVLVPDTVFYTLTYDAFTAPDRNFGAYMSRSGTTVGSAGQLMSQDSTSLEWTPGAFTTPDDCVEMLVTAVACYADCNGDGAANLADFGCFQTKFALGEGYADCNGDGVLNLSDFGCFTTRFAQGCP